MTKVLYSRRPGLSHQQRSAGFTLVELIVALALGLFLMGGLISMFVSNQQNFKSNENLARLQESARFAVEQMGREIRDAGINPCGVRTVNNILRTNSFFSPSTPPWWADWNAGTVVGFDDNQTPTGFNSQAFGTIQNRRVLGTDAILVLRSGMDEGVLHTVQNHNTITGQITLDRIPSNYTNGDAVFMCDGNSAVIFQITEPLTTPFTSPIIGYNNLATLNCSTQMGWTSSVDCNISSTFKQFQPGSFLTKYDPAFWYVGNSDTGRRSLFRSRLVATNNSGTLIPSMQRQEMVPDVDGMQIEYLTRNAPLPVGTTTVTPILATTWVSANDAKFDAVNNGWSTANLDQAIAVRVTLFLSSRDAVGIDANTGGTASITRQVVAVFSLRNREWIQ